MQDKAIAATKDFHSNFPECFFIIWHIFEAASDGES